MKNNVLALINKYTEHFFITPTKDNKSIIMLIFSYKPFELLNKSEYAQIDAYYFVSNESYHKTKQLCEELNAIGVNAKYNFNINYKKLAYEEGVVGVGKNTLCYTSKFGSRFVMQAMEIDGEYEFSPKNTKLQPNCTECNLCERACPTGAITKDGFDAKKCLRFMQESKHYLTDEAAKKMQNKLLGCDICQVVCPYNKEQIRVSVPDDIKEKLKLVTLLKKFENKQFNKEEWSVKIGKNYARENLLLPNLVLIVGNSNKAEFIPLLHYFDDHNNQLIRKNIARSIKNLQADKKE